MTQRAHEEESAKNANPPTVRENGADQPSLDQTRPPSTLPIMPLRGTVVFPGTVVPITVQRPASLRLLEETMPNSRWLGFVTQRDEEQEEPRPEDLFHIGVVGQVGKLIRQPQGGVVILAQVQNRIRIVEFTDTEGYFTARVELLKESLPSSEDDYWQAALNNLRDSAIALLNMNSPVPEEGKLAIANIDDPVLLTDFIAGNLGLDTQQKQHLLEQTDVDLRVQNL